VTFTAIETPTDGGGSVAFYADGSTTPISGCGARLLTFSTGTYQASCPTSTLGAGPHSISATYSGDTDYAGSSGSLPGGQVVSRASTDTTLASSVNPSVHHQPVIFTATVVPTDGSGTVAFLAGTKVIPHCAAQTLSPVGADYEATCSDSTLKVGPHGITAAYSGDTDYLPSTSTALIQKVKAYGAPGFITPVLGSPQSSPVGLAFAQPLDVEVTDLYGNVIPGALVTFTAPTTGPSGTFPLGFTSATAVTDSGGHAVAPVFTANSLVGGPYDVTASIGAVSGSFVLTNLPPVPETAVSLVPTHVELAGGGTTPAFLVSAVNTGLVPTVGTLTCHGHSLLRPQLYRSVARRGRPERVELLLLRSGGDLYLQQSHRRGRPQLGGPLCCRHGGTGHRAHRHRRPDPDESRGATGRHRFRPGHCGRLLSRCPRGSADVDPGPTGGSRVGAQFE
jgi:hypothetical protein